MSATAKKTSPTISLRLALRPEISPVVLRRFAWWAVACLVIIVGSGTTVRMTGSGLGCPHWPTCNATHALPKGYHSDIEFSNRVVSAITVFSTLALAFAAWHTRELGRRVKWLATAVFVGTAAQAPLGAITVYYHLDPYLVISHLLLSLSMLGLGVLTLLESSRLVLGSSPPLPAIARLGGAVLALAVCVLLVTGTLSTASGRFPGSSGSQVVERIWVFHTAVWLHVRAVAAFGIVYLVLTGWAWLRRREWPWLLRGCVVLFVLLAVQMGIGELQYRTYGTVPWFVVVAHVVMAATVFGWTIALVGRLYRPIRH